MNVIANMTRLLRRWLLLVVLGLAIVLVPLFIGLASRDNDRMLKPIRSTTTPAVLAVVDGAALPISFVQLNQDPFALRDKRIQVTGIFAPVSPGECSWGKGPRIEWALVAEDLRLNAVGFENVVRQTAPGVELTVEGTWRAYEGPAGCGKAPPNTIIWYLEVDRIVSPNPLLARGGRVEFDVSGTTGLGVPTGFPGASETPTPVPTVTDDTSSGTPSPDPSAGTIVAGTPSPSASPQGNLTPPLTQPAVTRTGTPGLTTATAVSTASITPSPTGTPTSTAVGTNTPTSVATIGATLTPQPTAPPLSTATPGNGYPGPEVTPTITRSPTPGPYP